MPPIFPAIACNLDAEILSASYPLLEESRVAAIEWAFDALFDIESIPDWFSDLLHTYGQSGRLIGHGVFFSLFSGKWRPEQQTWLEHLRRVSREFHFDQVTEHFGFMTGKDFHHGAPLNIPYTPVTLQIGQDRLKRIADACECPVGLENLAFSYSQTEVRRHGEFLERLLEPVNGFIILDLHNFYCQMKNFDLPYADLIDCYPLHRVREIHISGGSWEESMIEPGRKIRRDTHDDAVPAEVFDLLEATLPRCPHLKYTVLEQLGTGLSTPASRTAFYQDFLRMESTLERYSNSQAITSPNQFTPPWFPQSQQPTSSAGPNFSTNFPQSQSPGNFPGPKAPTDPFPQRPFSPSVPPLEDETLYRQQLELSDILETSTDLPALFRRLQASSLANSAWQIESWAPAMLETAMRIAQKWKKN